MVVEKPVYIDRPVYISSQPQIIEKPVYIPSSTPALPTSYHSSLHDYRPYSRGYHDTHWRDRYPSYLDHLRDKVHSYDYLRDSAIRDHSYRDRYLDRGGFSGLYDRHSSAYDSRDRYSGLYDKYSTAYDSRDRYSGAYDSYLRNSYSPYSRYPY